MKKQIITTLILTMSLGGVCSLDHQEVDSIEIGGVGVTTISTSRGVGYSINLAKHEFVDYNQIKFDNPVFDMSWVNSHAKVKTTLNETSTVINHSNSFEGFANELKLDANLSSSYSQDYSLFIGSAANRFNDITSMEYSEHTYQYYSSYNHLIKSYSYALPDYTTDLSNYKRYLSDDYYADAEDLLLDALDSTTFFERYGTHVIAEGVFGGKLEINYSLVSNSYDVWNQYYTLLTNYINNNLYSKVGVDTTITFDPYSYFNFYEARANQKTSILTKGGSVSVTPSISNLYTVYSEWSSSVSTSPTLIEATSDGLIPLWDLLPTPYDNATYRNIFINKYKEYASSCNDTIIDNYEPNIFDMTNGVETGFELVRPGEVTVTDDGIFMQDYDVVNINTHFELKYDYMRAHGYTKMDIYVEMKVKEVNMGYQIVALYNSESTSSSYEFGRLQFEYGGTWLDNDYGDTVGYLCRDVPINTFYGINSNDRYKLVIRYSADGTGEDTWVNKEIYVNIVYFK